MSVNNLDNKVVFTGDGSTDAFPFTFKIYLTSDVVVSRVVITTGVETVGVLDTDYSVSINGVLGGTVTTIGDWEDTSTAYKIVIRRVLPLTQLSSLVNNEVTPAETFEDGYDRLVMICQQLQEQLNRAMKLNPDETTAPTYTEFLALVVASVSIIGVGATRGVFNDGDLVAGVLTITHSKGLTAPYTVQVIIFNNSGKQVIPDDVTGGANAVAVDLTNFGTLTGNWGYLIL